MFIYGAIQHFYQVNKSIVHFYITLLGKRKISLHQKSIENVTIKIIYSFINEVHI